MGIGPCVHCGLTMFPLPTARQAGLIHSWKFLHGGRGPRAAMTKASRRGRISRFPVARREGTQAVACKGGRSSPQDAKPA